MDALSMLLTLLLCLPHKLCATIEVRNDKLVVEAFYDNDLPAEQAKVILSGERTVAARNDR
jgi:hypothetical protein